MKNFIGYHMRNHSTIFKHPNAVVAHLFSTLGNGIDMDHHGYLLENYQGTEAYEFPEPKAYTWVYPWAKSEDLRPFLKYAGCRDVGFLVTAQYFIDCIKATPDDVENVKDWKDNLHIVEDVLLNTPVIEPRYTIDDMALFLQDIEDSEPTSNAPVDGTKIDSSNSVYKVWFFDVQWSDCPTIVEDEVRSLWRCYELGNDYYMWKTTLDSELFEEYPRIYFWLRHKGVSEGEKVIVHWWW